MKRILLAAAGLLLPSLACAADARMTYKTADGMYAQAALGSLTCGVDSSGVPQLCQTDGVTASSDDSTDARIAYQTAGGMWALEVISIL